MCLPIHVYRLTYGPLTRFNKTYLYPMDLYTSSFNLLNASRISSSRVQYISHIVHCWQRKMLCKWFLVTTHMGTCIRIYVFDLFQWIDWMLFKQIVYRNRMKIWLLQVWKYFRTLNNVMNFLQIFWIFELNSSNLQISVVN